MPQHFMRIFQPYISHMLGPWLHFQMREDDYSLEKEDMWKVIWIGWRTNALSACLVDREEWVHRRKDGIVASSILGFWNRHSQRSEKLNEGKKGYLNERKSILLAYYISNARRLESDSSINRKNRSYWCSFVGLAMLLSFRNSVVSFEMFKTRFFFRVAFGSCLPSDNS